MSASDGCGAQAKRPMLTAPPHWAHHPAMTVTDHSSAETYHRPGTVQEAMQVLGQGPVTIAAGCTDLFPATQARALSGPVLDITGIAALRGIGMDGGALRIGAGASWADVVRADLPPAFDMLKEAAAEVGSVQIQNAATLAGNICNASPAADGMPCLLALDAEVEIASGAGDLRRLPLAEFVTGVRRTALQPGEMVTGILIPEDGQRGRSRFLKLGARRYLVISIAMVAARVEVEDGMVSQAAIAVGACSAVATRLPALEAALKGVPLSGIAETATDDLILPALDPIGDIRADAPYRGTAAAELVRRALHDLAEDAA